MEKKIIPFLDENERIKQLPAKFQTKLAVLEYLASKFEIDRDYTEKEVNLMVDNWSTLGDCFLLRRELVDNELLGRTKNGSSYWRIKKDDSFNI